jgi:hypothetical protein
MVMRLVSHKIGLITSSVLSLILLSFPTISIVDNISNNSIDDNNIVDEEKVITENKKIESDQEELQDEIKTDKQEVLEDKKENTTSTTSNTSTTNNSNKETNSDTKQESISTSSTSNISQVNEEVPKEENQVVNQYIGVPNPNDFYYSFHHGKIEYSSMDSCLADVPNIALKDTIDIINTWCIDVVDEEGTILGQYLYINCSSGNCDKYK